MEPSSNDPLYYLQVIAENAEEQKAASQKLQQRLTQIFILLAVLVITLTFTFFVAYRSRMSQKEALTWRMINAADNQGDLTKELTLIDRWIERNPNDFEALYRKGKLLLMSGDREGAKKSFQAACDIFPVEKYKDAADAFKPKSKSSLNATPTVSTNSTVTTHTNSTAVVPAAPAPPKEKK